VYSGDRLVRLGTAGGWYRTVLDELADVERVLWLVVVVTLVVDVWLTHLGLAAGLREGNPVMRLAIETFGIAVLVVVKIAVLALAGAARRALSGPDGVVVPLGVALPWAAAVCINGTLIFGA
jgi:hypothetical protein